MRTKFLIAGVVLALPLSVPAFAADLATIKGPMLAPVAAPYSWTGFYMGAQLGYGWGKDATTEYLTNTWMYVGLRNEFKPKGVFGGLHAGVNYQMGSFVLGAEADLEITDIKGGFADPPAAPFNPGGYGRTRFDGMGSIRARFGFAWDRTLIYATGGFAGTQMKSTYSTWGLVSESFSKFIPGYTIGAGIEHAVTDRVTVRAEYRRTNFNLSKNHSVVAFPGFSGTQEPMLDTVRIGASYKF